MGRRIGELFFPVGDESNERGSGAGRPLRIGEMKQWFRLISTWKRKGEQAVA
jgi:hypothetical protein